jgi:hypothetical protein
MTDLSPAAQSVLDAYRSTHLSINNLAAALRAAANRARHPVKTSTPSTDWGKGWKQGAMDIAEGLLAIAAELDNNATH